MILWCINSQCEVKIDSIQGIWQYNSDNKEQYTVLQLYSTQAECSAFPWQQAPFWHMVFSLHSLPSLVLLFLQNVEPNFRTAGYSCSYCKVKISLFAFLPWNVPFVVSEQHDAMAVSTKGTNYMNYLPALTTWTSQQKLIPWVIMITSMSSFKSITMQLDLICHPTRVKVTQGSHRQSLAMPHRCRGWHICTAVWWWRHWNRWAAENVAPGHPDGTSKSTIEGTTGEQSCCKNSSLRNWR